MPRVKTTNTESVTRTATRLCFQSVVREEICLPSLPDNWLDELLNLLELEQYYTSRGKQPTALALEELKTSLKNSLSGKIPPTTRTPNASTLKRALQFIYARFSGRLNDKLGEHPEADITKVTELIINGGPLCGYGLNNRLDPYYRRYSGKDTFSLKAALESFRIDLVKKAAAIFISERANRADQQSVHVYNRFYYLANQLGYNVPCPVDGAKNCGTDERDKAIIIARIKAVFEAEYQPFAIIDSIINTLRFDELPKKIKNDEGETFYHGLLTKDNPHYDKHKPDRDVAEAHYTTLEQEKVNRLLIANLEIDDSSALDFTGEQDGPWHCVETTSSTRASEGESKGECDEDSDDDDFSEPVAIGINWNYIARIILNELLKKNYFVLSVEELNLIEAQLDENNLALKENSQSQPTQLLFKNSQETLAFLKNFNVSEEKIQLLLAIILELSDTPLSRTVQEELLQLVLQKNSKLPVSRSDIKTILPQEGPMPNDKFQEILRKLINRNKTEESLNFLLASNLFASATKLLASLRTDRAQETQRVIVRSGAGVGAGAGAAHGQAIEGNQRQGNTGGYFDKLHQQLSLLITTTSLTNKTSSTKELLEVLIKNEAAELLHAIKQAKTLFFGEGSVELQAFNDQVRKLLFCHANEAFFLNQIKFFHSEAELPLTFEEYSAVGESQIKLDYFFNIVEENLAKKDSVENEDYYELNLLRASRQKQWSLVEKLLKKNALPIWSDDLHSFYYFHFLLVDNAPCHQPSVWKAVVSHMRNHPRKYVYCTKGKYGILEFALKRPSVTSETLEKVIKLGNIKLNPPSPPHYNASINFLREIAKSERPTALQLEKAKVLIKFGVRVPIEFLGKIISSGNNELLRYIADERKKIRTSSPEKYEAFQKAAEVMLYFKASNDFFARHIEEFATGYAYFTERESDSITTSKERYWIENFNLEKPLKPEAGYGYLLAKAATYKHWKLVNKICQESPKSHMGEQQTSHALKEALDDDNASEDVVKAILHTSFEDHREIIQKFIDTCANQEGDWSTRQVAKLKTVMTHKGVIFNLKKIYETAIQKENSELLRFLSSSQMKFLTLSHQQRKCGQEIPPLQTSTNNGRTLLIIRITISSVKTLLYTQASDDFFKQNIELFDSNLPNLSRAGIHKLSNSTVKLTHLLNKTDLNGLEKKLNPSEQKRLINYVINRREINLTALQKLLSKFKITPQDKKAFLKNYLEQHLLGQNQSAMSTVDIEKAICLALACNSNLPRAFITKFDRFFKLALEKGIRPSSFHGLSQLTAQVCLPLFQENQINQDFKNANRRNLSELIKAVVKSGDLNQYAILTSKLMISFMRAERCSNSHKPYLNEVKTALQEAEKYHSTTVRHRSIRQQIVNVFSHYCELLSNDRWFTSLTGQQRSGLYSALTANWQSLHSLHSLLESALPGRTCNLEVLGIYQTIRGLNIQPNSRRPPVQSRPCTTAQLLATTETVEATPTNSSGEGFGYGPGAVTATKYVPGPGSGAGNGSKLPTTTGRQFFATAQAAPTSQQANKRHIVVATSEQIASSATASY